MFTKKNVITARFINDSHTTVEVVHTIKGDDKARPYILEYDKDSADFKALAKAGWDLEAVTDATAEYKREASSMWNNAINEAAVEMNKTNKPVTILSIFSMYPAKIIVSTGIFNV